MTTGRDTYPPRSLEAWKDAASESADRAYVARRKAEQRRANRFAILVSLLLVLLTIAVLVQGAVR